MRRLQNFDRQQQVSFTQMFPELDRVVAVEDTDKYRFMAISVFDHWLSEEESNQLLSDVSDKEQALRDQKFDLLSNKIIESTQVKNGLFV